MKKHFFILSFLFCATFIFANGSETCSTCPTPQNVQTTSKAPGSISFDWDDCSDASYFEVWYVRQSDGYTSTVQTISNSTFTFSGLQGGDHDFYFVEICVSGSSTAIIMDEFIMN